MSKTLKWVLGIDTALILAALVFWLVTGALGLRGGMMTGFRTPFWGLGMLGGMAGPAVVIGLSPLGVVWLVQTLAARTAEPAAAAPVVSAPPAPAVPALCPHCGQPIQSGWKACPYCAEKL